MDELTALSPTLSPADRALLAEWLTEFDQSWAPGRLEQCSRDLPPSGHPLRLPTLVGMVRIDLRRQWRSGHAALVEEYLKRYPELGTVAQPPLELLEAEYRVRQEVGTPVSTTQLALRFPEHATHIRGLSSASQSATNTNPPCDTEQPRPPVDVAPAPKSAAPGPPPSGEVPNPFGRYRILKPLGRGGMGTVYLAQDTQLDRPVALKIPNFADGDEPSTEVPARFRQEARAASRLRHPNICSVYDVGQIDGIHYLTMAYIEGEPLSDRIRKRRLPRAEAMELVRTIGLALAYAHGQGVIHRDVKPSNVMIGPRGEPVLMDFGLARRADTNSARLTQTGQAIGTVAYMAPEQLRGELAQMGPVSDVYSLGVILYELLTGHLPFEGRSTEIVMKLLTEDAPPLSRHDPSLKDSALERLVQKALAKSVSSRFASMDEFAKAIGAVLAGSEHASATATTPVEIVPLDIEHDTEPAASLPSAASRLSSRRSAPRQGQPVALIATLIALGVLAAGTVYLLSPGAHDHVHDHPTPDSEPAHGETVASVTPSPEPVIQAVPRTASGSATEPEPAAKIIPPQPMPVVRRPEPPPGEEEYQEGLRSYLGRATAFDRRAAFERFEAAARKGHVLAQSFVGLMASDGTGTTKNEPAALDWLEKCRPALMKLAEAGDPIAETNLARIISHGLGVDKDEAEAIRWLRKAADRGSVQAMTTLGVMLSSGRGAPKDDAEAARLYRLAAEQGFAPAQSNLGRAYRTGQGVAKDEAESAKWYRLAAEQGDARGQLEVGWDYANGRGVAQDDAEAVRWYRKAADQGLAPAEYRLGTMFAEGRGVPQDDAEAVRWLRKAALQKNTLAANSLGFMYEFGRGVTKDEAEAVRWYRTSAEGGDPTAQTNLGWMYETGRGTTMDLLEASRWYRKAAGQNQSRAQHNLGKLYELGRGVEKNASEARFWYTKASDQGYEPARQALQRLNAPPPVVVRKTEPTPPRVTVPTPPPAMPNPNLKTLFGTRTLRTGFLPDPSEIKLTAGGPLETRLGGAHAWVTTAPSYSVGFSAGKAPLTIYVQSDTDTTLLINLPDSSWIANDDGPGTGRNPLIKILTPQSGRYDIWVGTFTRGITAPATLYISELK